MRKILSLSVVLFLCVKLFAQTADQVLLTIDNKPVTIGEFERIYKKNSNIESSEKKSITEYLDLFINFKLKVIEAENIGLDTNKAFKTELEGYRKQLAKPYLTDKETDEKILKEAYDRMLWDIRAGHILVKVDEEALPKDTLEAYNKAMKIRKRILAGEAFDVVAKELSDDPSAKTNGGDLGYFTAFQMVYSFESAAYKLNSGDVSMPVRTKFGYHILKISDKRKAKGQLKVAHIMKTTKNSTPELEASAKNEIYEIYGKIKEGQNFEELAKSSSDDKGSAVQGGVLPMFGTGRMVPEFEQASFALENIGDISQPVKTSFGWHIIKLIEVKPIGTYDEVKGDIKANVVKDSRSEMSRKSLVAELKKEYNYIENKNNLVAINKMVDKTIFEGTWKKSETVKLDNEIFSFANQKITQLDFVSFIEKNQKKTKEIKIEEHITNLYNQFTENTILAYEESILDKKYPEYNYLIKEYHDGILLFELTDKLVWSKASKDTLGLEKFHKENEKNYMWGTRVDATIYDCPNLMIAEKAKPLAEKRISKGYTAEVMAAKFLKITNNRDSLTIKINDNIYSKGDNKKIDAVDWTVGVKNVDTENGKNYFVAINKIVEPTPKTLKEAKGIVTADYQTYLEKEWIKSLREKYKVTVNQDVLSTVKE
jgi:peptidyl-prolyl cis-trans isomerase SurA